MKKAVAWAMVAVSVAGMTASQFELVGQTEPKLVLQLSWAALFFAGIDGALVAHKDE